MKKQIVEGSKEFLKISHIFSSQELRKKRLELCESCDMLGNVASVLNCTSCGCFIKPKIAIKLQNCPIGKW